MSGNPNVGNPMIKVTKGTLDLVIPLEALVKFVPCPRKQTRPGGSRRTSGHPGCFTLRLIVALPNYTAVVQLKPFLWTTCAWR
jgi:hypothetical protein